MTLLRRYVRHGSDSAFGELFGRHHAWVRHECRRALGDADMAEDAAQDVFVTLARRARELSPATRLSGWLYNAARYAVRDARKREARRARRQRSARERALQLISDIDRRRGDDDGTLRSRLSPALARLNVGDRVILKMRFTEGLTPAEVAARLGIGRYAARKRLTRAIARLRGQFTSVPRPPSRGTGWRAGRPATARPDGRGGSPGSGRRAAERQRPSRDPDVRERLFLTSIARIAVAPEVAA